MLCRTRTNSAFIKLYLDHAPATRARREFSALQIAHDLDLAVPEALEVGEAERYAWTVVRVVPGSGLGLRDGADLDLFLRHAIAWVAALQGAVPQVPTGPGWPSDERDLWDEKLLVRQLSSRAQGMRWWPSLRSALSVVDAQPTVLLHGDVKPEHLIVSDQRAFLVDWETASLGPASLDYADMAFHALRDAVYGGGDVRRSQLEQAARLLDAAPLRDVQGWSAALAWRVAIWADRRRPNDLNLLPGLHLRRIVESAGSLPTLHALYDVLSTMRRLGTPR